MMDYKAIRPKKLLGIRISALLEMAVFFLSVLLLNAFMDASSPRFIESWPHPFWIIILLLSVQYGSNEGLLAVLLATLLLLVGNLPDQRIDQDVYAWVLSIVAQPLMWLLAAVILGEIRMRHIRERDRLAQELKESKAREETFATAYETVRQRKERLELSVAAQVRTETAAYRAAKAMETLDPDQVVEGVATMVESAMGAEKFSLYLLEGEVLQRKLTHGWSEQDEDAYDAVYRVQDPIYQAIIARKDTLCVINEEQERILASHGILASPLLDTSTGRVLGMLKIERIPFLELNLNTVETFRALCEWIAIALTNARYYQSAVSDTTVNPEHNLMTRSFFNRYRDYITALARRLKFNVFMLGVTVTNHDALDAEMRIRLARLLSETVDKTLRNVDFAFDYQQDISHYAVVLPATDARGAEIVRDRIEKELQRVVNQQVRGARFAFTLTALHEVQG
jgi:polysaccharide biosynthesis protein PelD